MQTKGQLEVLEYIYMIHYMTGQNNILQDKARSLKLAERKKTKWMVVLIYFFQVQYPTKIRKEKYR